MPSRPASAAKREPGPSPGRGVWMPGLASLCSAARDDEASARLTRPDRSALYPAGMTELASAATSTVLTATSAGARVESRLHVIARTAFPFLVVGIAWELVAHLG